MKLALLVALSVDRRRGNVIGSVMPFDEALKALRATEEGIAPGPIVQLVPLTPVKEKYFRSVQELGEALPDAEQVNALLAGNAALEEQVKLLEADKLKLESQADLAKDLHKFNEKLSSEKADALARIKKLEEQEAALKATVAEHEKYNADLGHEINELKSLVSELERSRALLLEEQKAELLNQPDAPKELAADTADSLHIDTPADVSGKGGRQAKHK